MTTFDEQYRIYEHMAVRFHPHSLETLREWAQELFVGWELNYFDGILINHQQLRVSLGARYRIKETE